jgi:hypothetical protein
VLTGTFDFDGFHFSYSLVYYLQEMNS